MKSNNPNPVNQKYFLDRIDIYKKVSFFRRFFLVQKMVILKNDESSGSLS
jgi:hypothetical protein